MFFFSCSMDADAPLGAMKFSNAKGPAVDPSANHLNRRSAMGYPTEEPRSRRNERYERLGDPTLLGRCPI